MNDCLNIITGQVRLVLRWAVFIAVVENGVLLRAPFFCVCLLCVSLREKRADGKQCANGNCQNTASGHIVWKKR